MGDVCVGIKRVESFYDALVPFFRIDTLFEGVTNQMEKQEKNGRDYYSIDLLHIVKSLWRRAWLIGLCGLLVAALGFALSAFLIKPKYSSSVELYVNNKTVSLGGNSDVSISASDLTASQSLVRTYGVILCSRSTLEQVIEKAGLDCTWKDLSKQIEYAPSNDTEVMRVTVTTYDPYESSDIANTIAEVLPDRISDIIDGATMKLVNSAVPELEKVSPSITMYTVIGMMLGILLMVIILVVQALMDDTIHDSDYVLKTYNYPVLGKVPNLVHSSGKSYGGYYTQKSESSHKEKNKEGN